ncbi:translation initiation factor IF-2-like [Pipistrellus kuhlii]|uniref:translation initiation factor IF-2-like n=1 Tax=Pipistrellus kuhlii TaxID=59472 RepID=UPI001E272F65|nr:translation initiation factor IF-2-like [Pipistrellus kuhlii]
MSKRLNGLNVNPGPRKAHREVVRGDESNHHPRQVRPPPPRRDQRALHLPESRRPLGAEAAAAAARPVRSGPGKGRDTRGDRRLAVSERTTGSEGGGGGSSLRSAEPPTPPGLQPPRRPAASPLPFGRRAAVQPVPEARPPARQPPHKPEPRSFRRCPDGYQGFPAPRGRRPDANRPPAKSQAHSPRPRGSEAASSSATPASSLAVPGRGCQSPDLRPEPRPDWPISGLLRPGGGPRAQSGRLRVPPHAPAAAPSQPLYARAGLRWVRALFLGPRFVASLLRPGKHFVWKPRASLGVRDDPCSECSLKRHLKRSPMVTSFWYSQAPMSSSL